MSHVRQQIREAVKGLLTGLTTTGDNVEVSRIWPETDANLPGLKIYTQNENSERMTMGSNPRIDRECELVIEARVKQPAALDGQLDKIAAEVEARMAGDSKLGGLAKGSWLASTEIEFAEGDTAIGTLKLNYAVRYHTLAANPETAA